MRRALAELMKTMPNKALFNDVFAWVAATFGAVILLAAIRNITTIPLS